MAKNKKKKPAQVPAQKVKPENYIRERARKLPIHECLMGESSGFVMIDITRKRANGNLILGFYLIDMGCLGVKSCGWYFDITEDQYATFLKKQMQANVDLKPSDPQLAFNIIYGAVEYAEAIGFKPHRDFKVAEYILDEEVAYMEVEFGKDGKPFYCSGPYDNVQVILNTLNRTVGPGNYEFIHVNDFGPDLYLDNDEEYDDEVDEDDKTK